MKAFFRVLSLYRKLPEKKMNSMKEIFAMHYAKQAILWARICPLSFQKQQEWCTYSKSPKLQYFWIYTQLSLQKFTPTWNAYFRTVCQATAASIKERGLCKIVNSWVIPAALSFCTQGSFLALFNVHNARSRVKCNFLWSEGTDLILQGSIVSW